MVNAKIKTIENKLKASEEKISLILGIGVVLLVAGLILNYWPNRTKSGSVDIAGETQDGVAQPKSGEALEPGYTVSKGENLWQIAEKKLGSGYAWQKIAELNKLSNPDVLEVGQVLVLPSQAETDIVALPKTGPLLSTDELIKDDVYTVQTGDSLSKIALRAYGDMFAWAKIFEANRTQVVDPHTIEPGMVLVLPRDNG